MGARPIWQLVNATLLPPGLARDGGLDDYANASSAAAVSNAASASTAAGRGAGGERLIGHRVFFRSCTTAGGGGAAAAGGSGGAEEEHGGDAAAITAASPPAPLRRGPVRPVPELEEGDQEKDEEDEEEEEGAAGGAATQPASLLADAAQLAASPVPASSSLTRNRTDFASLLTGPRPTNPDESSVVLCFLGFNLIVLALSALSLRRQQRALTEKTLQGLYSHVDGTVANGVTVRGGRPRSSAAANSEAGQGVIDNVGIGRSIESLATAVATAGATAVERTVSAVTFEGEWADSSEQKMK